MSHEKDHSKKYKILEEMQRVYPMPDLDKILPPDLDSIEDKMSEQEFSEFVTKRFNKFFSKYINTNEKDFFVNLPLEFFTEENADRVRRYANIAMYDKVEGAEMKYQADYYKKLHEKLLAMLTKKKAELIAKTKHEQTLIIKN